MHPVGILFEDVYRNHWGISPDEDRARARRMKNAILNRLPQKRRNGREKGI